METQEIPSSTAGPVLVALTPPATDINDNEEEPPLKKSKLMKIEPTESLRDRLESRLINVLSCVVCFDLPNGAIYQCQNGHLMCTGCFNHLLADGRLKNEPATCPTCRVEINAKTTSRNLAVEKAVSELPTHCKYCTEEFPRNLVPEHEKNNCDQRPVKCKYRNLGCPWDGMHHQVQAHLDECGFPQKHGVELLEGINNIVSEVEDEHKRLRGLFTMFSYEKISISDIQLSPSRTDDYIPKLYYETNRFSAFDALWVLRAKVIGNETSYNRSLTYQLALKGKGNFEVKYFLLKGPFGDANIEPEVQRFEFRDDTKESEYHPLGLIGDLECNRLLASSTINVRLIMFLVKK